MGISAWHLLKGQQREFFLKSFRIALTFSLVFSAAEVVQGHLHGGEVAKIQPTKLAAMEAFWETSANAPFTMFLIPDEKNEKNLLELIKVPGALSMLAYHSPGATVKGLRDFPKEERPPVLLSFISFRVMVALAFLFLLLSLLCFFKRATIESARWLLWAMVASIPLPYVACEAGWMLTEVGRQPWIVYGLMKTADAASPVNASQVLLSLAGFIVVYSLLGLCAFYLMYRTAMKGPEITAEGEVGRQ
jgi:cytochrome d ubiquinol oxidase subunit I